jgi:hypothetical protein
MSPKLLHLCCIMFDCVLYICIICHVHKLIIYIQLKLVTSISPFTIFWQSRFFFTIPRFLLLYVCKFIPFNSRFDLIFITIFWISRVNILVPKDHITPKIECLSRDCLGILIDDIVLFAYHVKSVRAIFHTLFKTRHQLSISGIVSILMKDRV